MIISNSEGPNKRSVRPSILVFDVNPTFDRGIVEGCLSSGVSAHLQLCTLFAAACGFFAGFLELTANIPFGCYDIDFPLYGNITVILVPLPRALVIFNSPPICATRSRMPVRPTPSC
jgi:hypothetical protein